MTAAALLTVTLAVGWYNVGTVWAMEIDIFRSWQFVGAESYHLIQQVHWRKLPYWIFTPVGLGLAGSIALLWYRPSRAPLWGAWGSVTCQLVSLLLTAGFWGRWQAKLSQDESGPKSPYLRMILRTHWVRTLLITSSALFLLASTILSAT